MATQDTVTKYVVTSKSGKVLIATNDKSLVTSYLQQAYKSKIANEYVMALSIEKAVVFFNKMVTKKASIKRGKETLEFTIEPTNDFKVTTKKGVTINVESIEAKVRKDMVAMYEKQEFTKPAFRMDITKGDGTVVKTLEHYNQDALRKIANEFSITTNDKVDYSLMNEVRPYEFEPNTGSIPVERKTSYVIKMTQLSNGAVLKTFPFTTSGKIGNWFNKLINKLC